MSPPERSRSSARWAQQTAMAMGRPQGVPEPEVSTDGSTRVDPLPIGGESRQQRRAPPPACGRPRSKPGSSACLCRRDRQQPQLPVGLAAIAGQVGQQGRAVATEAPRWEAALHPLVTLAPVPPAQSLAQPPRSPHRREPTPATRAGSQGLDRTCSSGGAARRGAVPQCRQARPARIPLPAHARPRRVGLPPQHLRRAGSGFRILRGVVEIELSVPSREQDAVAQVGEQHGRPRRRPRVRPGPRPSPPGRCNARQPEPIGESSDSDHS